MRVSVTSNAGEVAAYFRELARTADDKVEKELRQLGPRVVTEVQRATPVDTGNARRMWHFRRVDGGVEIKNSARYAGFIRQGALVRLVEGSVERRLPERLEALATRLVRS